MKVGFGEALSGAQTSTDVSETEVKCSVGWKNEVDIYATHETARCEWWKHLIIF